MTRTIPGIDKPLSRIVLGTMIITTDNRGASFQLLDDALACGISTLDTAVVYAGGKSEICIGEWINDRGNRDDVVIISKGCHQSGLRKRVTPFDLLADVHDSLARLKLDCVDLYLFHRDDETQPVGPLVDAMNQMIGQGKIKAYGGSNWTHERIQAANAYANGKGLVPMTASSPNYGLAETVESPWGPGCVSLSGDENAAARAWYCETGLAVFAYSSLARGLFSGRVTRENCKDTTDDACQRAYCHEVNFQKLDRVRTMADEKGVTVPQLALAYVLNSSMNVYALAGAANKQECEQLVEAANIRLTRDERKWLADG